MEVFPMGARVARFSRRRSTMDKDLRRPENASRRKRVEQMTEKEKIRALLTDELTGLGNRRAWEERERRPFQAMVDVEGLKWVNDNLGWAAGDALLRTVAAAIRAQGVSGYRLGGDEFVFEGESWAAVEAVVAGVGRYLRKTEIEATLVDGTTKRFRGATVHAGIGRSLDEADAAVNDAKKAGVAAGLRAARGARPSGLREVAPSAATSRPASDLRFFLRALREADPDFGEEAGADVKLMSREWLTRNMR
jgi:diguanylate cyclase (GGDEF)-like protein